MTEHQSKRPPGYRYSDIQQIKSLANVILHTLFDRLKNRHIVTIMKTIPHQCPIGNAVHKAKNALKKTAAQVTYGILLFYYVISNADTSWNDKVKIYAACGYILLPYDLIPESIHIIGCTDDFAAVLIGYNAIRLNITPVITSRAGRQVWKWFKIRIKNKSRKSKLSAEKS